MNTQITFSPAAQDLNKSAETLREEIDYTEWQRNYFDNIPPEQLEADISKYFETHQDPFPNAVRL